VVRSVNETEETVANCIVPGCVTDAKNNLSIRLRRPDTSAIWAPNTEAFVCDAHALSGALITLAYEATTTGRVEVRAHGVGDQYIRVTPIQRVTSQTVADVLADRLP
jgi:hypothetical protein